MDISTGTGNSIGFSMIIDINVIIYRCPPLVSSRISSHIGTSWLNISIIIENIDIDIDIGDDKILVLLLTLILLLTILLISVLIK